MSTPLDGEVTRPSNFDPEKDYALVIARGNEALGDYDFLDAQRMMRQDAAVLSQFLIAEGALLSETGGTIAAARPGVNLGGDLAASAGTYIGIESQVYTVSITTGGVGGTATFTWKSTGSDGPVYGGEDVPITAIAPDLATALADLATYGHKVGLLGVQVVFANANLFLTGANSWVINVVFGESAPTVSGDDITLGDAVVVVAGRPHRVKGTTLTFPTAASGVQVVYGEFIRKVITHADDPLLKDPLSDFPQSWRERWRVVYANTDNSGVPLGSNEVEKRVFPLYFWDRATDLVTRVQTRPYAIDINRTQGALDAQRLLNVPQNALLRGHLAERTRGAHGSFVMSPLSPEPRGAKSSNTPSAGKIAVTLFPSKVSVEGIDIEHPRAEPIEVDQALDVLTVTAEGITFATGTDLYPLSKTVGVRTFPIKQITLLTATVQIGVIGVGSYEPVTGHTTNRADEPLANVATSIQRISDTQGGAEDYTDPTDYSLGAGGTIDWSAGGSEPGSGATYYVVYRYTKTMIGGGTDYDLSVDGEVDFTGGSDKPVDTTVFNTTYEYYLPRIDMVVVRPSGNYLTIKGIAGEEPVLPSAPPSSLPYVSINIPANSSDITVRRFLNDAIYMERINRMIAAIEELTRNAALQDLHNQAQDGTTGSPIDILAEDFSTSLQADENYNSGGVTYDATIDVVGKQPGGPLGTMPFTQATFSPTHIAPPPADDDVRGVTEVTIGTVGVGRYEQVIRATGGNFDDLQHVDVQSIVRISDTQGGPEDYAGQYTLTGNQVEWTGTKPADDATYYIVYTYNEIGTFWTLPFSDELAIDQPNYSRSHPVNPFQDATVEPPATFLTPDQDFFVDTSTRTETEVQQILKTQARRDDLISRAQISQFQAEFRAANGRGPRRGEVFGEMGPEFVGQSVAEMPALYMRTITLTGRGTRYVPGEQVRVVFDGKDVGTWTPIAPTIQGANGAQLKASANSLDSNNDVIRNGGTFTGTFPVPANVPTGTVLVQFYGDNLTGTAWASPIPGDWQLRGEVNFTSNGIIRETINQEVIVQVVLEPVAQSVIFPSARMISKVDVPIAAKPALAAVGSAPLVCQIRATNRRGQSSTPSSTILASIPREVADVQVGVSSSNPYTFVDPVLAPADEFRALMLRSASFDYEVYAGVLGEPNLAGTGHIEEQLIPGGVFMESSNNVDWTVKHAWDMRLKVWVAKMDETLAYLYLSRVTSADMTSFLLNVDQVIPDGTAIAWEYSTDSLALTNGAKVWRPFAPFNEQRITGIVDGAADLDIRAALSTSDVYVTPGVHKTNISVIVKSNKTALTYVSRQRTLTAPATAVKGEIKLEEPAGSTATVYVSVDNGATWSTVGSLGTAAASEDGFNHYSFSKTGMTAGSKMRGRIELTTIDKALPASIRDFFIFAEP